MKFLRSFFFTLRALTYDNWKKKNLKTINSKLIGYKIFQQFFFQAKENLFTRMSL